MFDFAWSELALIGVVALVAIGPKDMPVAIKAVAGMVKKARRMAGEFQGHVEDLIKEADLTDVRRDFGALRQFNLRDTVTRAVDPDGTLRATMADSPVQPRAPATLATDHLDGLIGEHPHHAVVESTGFAQNIYSPAASVGMTSDAGRPELTDPPAFVPPAAVTAERDRRAAPAFVPPQYAARGAAVDAGPT